MQDSRLGRFFAVDPLASKYPWNSSYAFSENIVINALELEGLEKVYVYNIWYDDNGAKQKKLSHTYIDNSLKNHQRMYQYYDAKGNVTHTKTQDIADYERNSQKTPIQNMKDAGWNDGKYGQYLEYAYKENFGSGDLGAGSNTGGEFEGVKGMYKLADAIDLLGDGLSYIPTPFTKTAGKILSVEADLLRTVADYNAMDASLATKNLIIRSTTFAIDEGMGKIIDRNSNSTKKYIEEQVVRKTLDKVKDANTTKP